MTTPLRIIPIIGSVLIALVGIGWLGLRVVPSQFPAFTAPSAVPQHVPLPNGLPVPVERFYRALYREAVPVITSAVITGRATMRIGGIEFPGRFRFVHDAGRGYRHYIEATMFGRPVIKVNEHYIDDKGRMELPTGVIVGEPKIDQGGSLALWAESIWLPAIWLTNPRVRWEPVDDTTAVLIVPFGQMSERLLVRFDPDTGMIRLMEAMRYKAANSATKTLWLDEALGWKRLNGNMLPTVGTVTWLDEGAPWAVFTVEDVVYNADVREYVRAKGL